jgi:uncharacterized Zn-binding protein involved in type VI secretion
MPGVSRVNADTAAGTIVGNLAPTVFVNGNPIAVKGADVSGHGRGSHRSPVMDGSSSTVYANGILICREGDAATCGHPATGSGNVFSGTFASFVVPPVVIAPATQAAINRQTSAYVANPGAYNVASNDQVKQNFPGTPQGADGESLIDTDVVLASDIPSLLSQNLDEAGKGIWEETGMGGRASNPKITGIWKELGYPQSGAWLTDQTAWCMGYVNWVLKRCGYRFVQTAWAFDIKNKTAAYKAITIPLNQGQPGDIALWSYGHVNFIYTASSGTYSFVGGNQSTKAKNVNNPSSGSVTRSWPSGYRTPGDNSLIGIFRPVKE